jgi:hypothetical protein
LAVGVTDLALLALIAVLVLMSLFPPDAPFALATTERTGVTAPGPLAWSGAVACDGVGRDGDGVARDGDGVARDGVACDGDFVAAACIGAVAGAAGGAAARIAVVTRGAGDAAARSGAVTGRAGGVAATGAGAVACWVAVAGAAEISGSVVGVVGTTEAGPPESSAEGGLDDSIATELP